MDFFNSDFGETAFATMIPALVSIIGFVMTYQAMKRSFRDEIKKQKSNIALDKMATVPFDVLQLYDHIMGPVTLENTIKTLGLSGREERDYRTRVADNFKNSLSEMKELQNTVYSYGSKEAIALLAIIKKLSYENQNNENMNMDTNIIVVYYILLATQIKYDVTGEVISPIYWYDININDFSKHKEKYKNYNNEVVKKLSLNKGMLVN